MAIFSLDELALEYAPWQQIQLLLDACYSRPPRDVFERAVIASHRRQRLWLASDSDGVLGLVMLSPHSKGGHLENLAVAPNARSQGIGKQLVLALLQAVSCEGPAMVSLTTRIPTFFSSYGFQPCGELIDGSIAMLIFLPSPAVSELLTL